jgi:hypothetical protein
LASQCLAGKRTQIEGAVEPEMMPLTGVTGVAVPSEGAFLLNPPFGGLQPCFQFEKLSRRYRADWH